MEQSNSSNPNLSNDVSSDRALNREEDEYALLVREQEDGTSHLLLRVEGIYCAACIQKIEGALNAQEDVSQARLNFTSGRLNVTWDGPAARANDFARITEDLGYRVHPYDPEQEESALKQEEKFLLLCMGVAGFAMGNIMLLSVGLWSTSIETMGSMTREFLHWISALIALPAILFSGRPFFRSALRVLSKGHTNMDVPIALALLLASGMSVFEMLDGGEHVYFDSAVMLMFFLLVGRYLDFRARKEARASAGDLLGRLSGFADVIEGGKTRRIPLREVKAGMIVRVAIGTSIPVDGDVQSGESEIDTSLVTGESLPRAVKKGDAVYAGTINLAAPLTIIAAGPGEKSLIADIAALMDQATQGQAHYVRLADRTAQLYTPVVHALGALAFCGWYFIGGIPWQDALLIAVTVLIITCPCALGLAVPVVQVLATGKLMKQGVLVKSGDALERLASISRAVFDKTGTLTLGRPALQGDYHSEDLALAASLGVHSAHPLSKAIAGAYEGQLFDIQNIKEHPGQGLQSKYDGKTIKLGSRVFCGDQNAPPANGPELWLKIGRQKPILFHFTDTPREDAKEVIAQFEGQGLNPVLLSGDRTETAVTLGKSLGIQKIYAEKTPPQKYDFVQLLKKDGAVLMVGDGLNDAPVLAGADVAIAPGTAIDMTQNAADIIVMGEKLAPVWQVYQTAVQTQKLVRQNFWLASAYNVVAIPIAVAGFVTPLVAALAMSGSSLLVIANSFRLKIKS